MLDIVFITDENYILPTKVAIRSIIKNASENTQGTIYVVCDFEKKALQNEFVKMETERFHINVIFPKHKININRDKKHLYVSSVALYKFALPELLPKLDRALYLDGDVIVKSDLQELFDTDMDGYYLAAVEDMCAVKTAGVLENTNNEHYFNSGVMLLNLSKLRDGNMTEHLIDERMQDDDMHFMDQNVLNRMLGDKTKYISIRNNFMKSNLNNFATDEIAEFYHLSIEEYKDICANPLILHLTNYLKPWNTYEAESFGDWFIYLEGEEIPSVLKKCNNYSSSVMMDAINVALERSERYMLSKLHCLSESYDYVLQRKQKEIDELREAFVKYVPRVGCEILASCDNKKKKRFVIYGAGEYAVKVFEHCIAAKREDEISAFAVTDVKFNPTSLFGVPVISVEEIKDKGKEITIIVAVGKTHLPKITETLWEMGFDDVVQDGLSYEW